MTQNKTASLLIIGNEILSGKTADKNLNHIALKLAAIGIDFVEVRVVRDVTTEIIEALNQLRTKHDYVFTTGGIGPTHDDITMDAVAKAFGVELVIDDGAKDSLKNYYKAKGQELNPARLRMAQFPVGAELIKNSITAAPGCKIGNVFVLAGIPAIMHVMLEEALPYLTKGSQVISASVNCNLSEGEFAMQLDEIQKSHTTTEIGSYPYLHEGKYAASLVVRSIDKAAVDSAIAKIKAMIAELGGKEL